MRLTFHTVLKLATGAAVLAAGVALSGVRPLRAQDATPKAPSDYIVPFSMLYVTAGKVNADPSSLNAHFNRTDVATGFSALSNDAYSVGFGGYVPISRVLAGFEWNYADFGYETSPQGKTNRGETSYFMATVGVPLYTTWHFTVQPFLGVGGGSMRVTLKNRDGGNTVSLLRDPTFDEIVLSPGSESQVIGKYVILQPGIGIDYIVLQDDVKSRLGVTFGVRFGTIITPNRTTWKYRGHEVFGGPTFQPSGGSLRIIIGIGGFKMAKQ